MLRDPGGNPTIAPGAMLRHIANGMEDEAIEISSSETVSDEDGDATALRSYLVHGKYIEIRNEVKEVANLICGKVWFIGLVFGRIFW